ncbi:hypothetical protein MPSEU_000540400 [Mayamaea pseudoterrestris]|nr:hypothetical protein MPSEU_000540400 [Mayamaea pseudoterrestris]
MKTAFIALLSLSSAFAFTIPSSQQASTARPFSAVATEEATPATSSKTGKEISAATAGQQVIYTSEQIDELLPHRYPFALVDKVVEYEAGKRAVGIKSVTKNEEFFNGHFPGRPIMPGVLQVEALAQLAGIVCLQMDGASPGAVFFFAGVDGVKWKKPVVPGDSLVMEVEIKKWNAKFGLAKASGRAYVDGTLVVEVGEMTFALAK